MIDRNIDESIRKPRRAKGTPFFKQRNYYALGLLGISALTGIAFEFWGESKKLKNGLQEGKFDYPNSLKEHIVKFQWNNDPAMRQALIEMQKKNETEGEVPRPQSSFSKLLQSRPDL